jgi:prophage antirepressor-like protein
MKTVAVCARLPEDLSIQLNDVCDALGYKKNRFIEIALRAKIDEVLDAQDLEEAVEDETGFSSLDAVRDELLGRE